MHKSKCTRCNVIIQGYMFERLRSIIIFHTYFVRSITTVLPCSTTPLSPCPFFGEKNYLINRCCYCLYVLPHTNIHDFMHLSPVILVLLGALNGKINWVNNLLTDPPRHANMELFLKMKGKPCLQTFGYWVATSYNLQNVHVFYLYTKHFNRGIYCSNCSNFECVFLPYYKDGLRGLLN